MFNRSVLLIQLLAVFACVCAEDGTTVTTEKPIKEGTTLEIAIVLAGLLAATTISVVVVLVPTIIYYNYRSKQEMEAAGESPITLH